MGAAAPFMPLIMSAVGTGVQVYNQNKTLRKQDQAAADQISQQARTQQEADAQVRNMIREQEQSGPEQHQADAMQQYMDTARRGQDEQTSALGGPGVSRFADDAAAAAAGISEYVGNTADIFSRIDAPSRQRELEARRYGRLGTDLGVLMDRSAGDRYLGDIRMRSIRSNPWLDVLGQTLTGAASGMGGMGGSSGMGSWAGQSVPGMTQQYPTWGSLGLGGGRGIFGGR